MAQFDNILVTNDQLEGLDQALSKAALIEHYTGCNIELASIAWNEIEDEDVPSPLKANLIENYLALERHGLRQLSQKYQDRVADIHFQALWSRQPDASIFELQRQLDSDLIIKPAAESELLDYIYAPLDWRIIRSSRCPVLISKSNHWQTGGIVLATVDVGDSKHDAINQRIVAVADKLARVLDAKVHLATAYPDLGQAVNERQVAMDYIGLKADMQAYREGELNKLTELSDQIAECHVLEGKAHHLVPHLARSLEATVTVVGTHARSGISNWVLGNTAERLLPRIHCDVLTIRPEDAESA